MLGESTPLRRRSPRSHRRFQIDLEAIPESFTRQSSERRRDQEPSNKDLRRSRKKLFVDGRFASFSSLLNALSVVIILSFLTSQLRFSAPNKHSTISTINQSDWTVPRTESPVPVESSFRSIDLPALPVSPDPDYGGLDLSFLYGHTFERTIPRNERELYEQYKFLDTLENDMAWQLEWLPHSNPNLDHDAELSYPVTCHPNNWRSNVYPTCNSVHEVVSFRDTEMTSLSRGYFRNTWVVHDDDAVIAKTLRMARQYTWEQVHEIEREAVVLERLSSSPRIVNVFSFCGASLLVEHCQADTLSLDIVPAPSVLSSNRGKLSQDELDQRQTDDVHPLNNLTVMEKLRIALVMAESLADLHGYEGGVMVHGDTHPDQWLRCGSTVDAQQVIKLNDFNNGMILEWNRDEQSYCDFYVGYGGIYKAPEELRGDYVNEAADGWAMGHGIYGLLTGLYPYYQLFNTTEQIQAMIQDRVKPFVDPRYRTRSFVEGQLVEIMERCWEFEPSKRADIFSVVQHLRETERLAVKSDESE